MTEPGQRALPYAPNWDQTARRTARIYLAGLAPGRAANLPSAGLTRADLEAGFSATPSR
jgi:hypothetical protein